jgi:hypothetical protein
LLRTIALVSLAEFEQIAFAQLDLVTFSACESTDQRKQTSQVRELTGLARAKYRSEQDGGTTQDSAELATMRRRSQQGSRQQGAKRHAGINQDTSEEGKRTFAVELAEVVHLLIIIVL